MARVLLVEDEGDPRLLYRIILKNKGYDVVDVGSSAEALSVLAEEPIDAVVLELGLPDINGLQLIDAIRSRQWFVPIIINAAYDFLGEDCHDWDVDDIVSKSSGAAALVRALNRIVPVELELQYGRKLNHEIRHYRHSPESPILAQSCGQRLDDLEMHR